MTQENLEAWRASIEELRAGTSELDREAWLARMAELWHPQIEFDVSEAPWLGLSGIYLGRDAIRELWREWFGSWETLQFDYELLDAGERVVMLVEWRLRARSSGNELPVWKNAWVSRFKDGVMVHSKLYMSHSEALEAAGLSEQAMSRENVEIVIGQLENTNVRDFKAVMDAYADDVVLRLHGWLRNIGGMAVVGKDAVGEWFGDWFRAFDRDYRFEIDEARDLGDRVLIVATHHGRGRASGAPATQQMGYLYTVRDGKVSLVEIWTDHAHALEATGLSE